MSQEIAWPGADKNDRPALVVLSEKEWIEEPSFLAHRYDLWQDVASIKDRPLARLCIALRNASFRFAAPDWSEDTIPEVLLMSNQDFCAYGSGPVLCKGVDSTAGMFHSTLFLEYVRPSKKGGMYNWPLTLAELRSIVGFVAEGAAPDDVRILKVRRAAMNRVIARLPEDSANILRLYALQTVDMIAARLSEA